MYTPRHTGLYVIRTSYFQQALQHILQKSSYNYPKRIDISTMTLMQLGPGILWAEGMWHIIMPISLLTFVPVTGSMHQRHRKVMNPAFSAQQLRTFVPLFQQTAVKVRSVLHDMVATTVLIQRWVGHREVEDPDLGEAGGRRAGQQMAGSGRPRHHRARCGILAAHELHD